jgi:hypothetical protein
MVISLENRDVIIHNQNEVSKSVRLK